MRLFTGKTVKTYKTQDNAIKAVEKTLGGEIDHKYHWVVATTPEGRYHVVVIGIEHAYLSSVGICVAA